MAYNKHHSSAGDLFDVFLDTLGLDIGLDMFPKLICSMKNKTKQEELNTVYKNFVENKNSPVKEQVRCDNEFFECGTCLEYMMTLY